MRMRYVLVACLLAVAACGSSGAPAVSPPGTGAVPEEFVPACGKPGSVVTTQRTRVVVKHADCDLTGVVIANQGGGATVPDRGEGVAGSGSLGTVTIQVEATTGDVTFTAGR